MTTFTDRLDQIHRSSEMDAEAAREQQRLADQARWDATVAQLRRLIEAELEIVDFPDAVRVHKDHTHGSPETDYAVVKLSDEIWLALPVSDGAAGDTRLLGLLHCPNGHVQGLEYPTSADDSWGQALMRLEERNSYLRQIDQCDTCVAERTPAQVYDTRTRTQA